VKRVPHARLHVMLKSNVTCCWFTSRAGCEFRCVHTDTNTQMLRSAWKQTNVGFLSHLFNNAISNYFAKLLFRTYCDSHTDRTPWALPELVSPSSQTLHIQCLINTNKCKDSSIHINSDVHIYVIWCHITCFWFLFSKAFDFDSKGSPKAVTNISHHKY
jgi:hypothetical protein